MAGFASLRADSSRFGSEAFLRLSDLLIFILFSTYVVAIFIRGYDFTFDDALFYFKISQSLAAGNGLVFGAGIPTNGFHPFWLLVCSALSLLSSEPEAFLRLMLAVTAALNAGSILVLRFGCSRFIQGLPLSLGILFSLPYFLFAGLGMESALTCFFLVSATCLAARFFVTHSVRLFVGASLCAGLAVFSRLDAVIIVLPLALYLIAGAVLAFRNRPSALALCVLGGVLALLPVASWLIFNSLYFGSVIPISGKLKLANSAGIGVGISARLRIMSGFQLLYLFTLVLGSAVRMILSRLKLDAFIFLCVGQIIYAVYLAFSGQTEIYAWYFVSLALVSGLGLALGLDSVRQASGTVTGTRLQGAAAVLLSLGVGVFSSYNMYRYITRPLAEMTGYRLSADRQMPDRFKPPARVLAFDRPGQATYFLGLDVIAIDGLTTNLAFQQDLRAHGIDWLIKAYNVTGFLGPTDNPVSADGFCKDQLYLGAMRFSCGAGGTFDRVRFFSRLDGSELGSINLVGLRKFVIPSNPFLTIYELPPPK